MFNGIGQGSTGRVFLFLMGLALIIAAFVFMLTATERKTLEIHQGVVTLLLAGLAAIVIAEFLPMLDRLKVGDFEVQFRDLGKGLTNDVDALKARVGKLEMELAARGAPAVFPPVPIVPPVASEFSVAAPEGDSGPARMAEPAAPTPTPVAAPPAPPPELDLPGPYPDDQRKGRFGGSPIADGLRLRADFPGRQDASWAKVVMTVEAERGSNALAGVDRVEFFLHQTFNEERVVVPVRDGRAQLTVTAWGGFTVGVWVANGQGTTLELDLAEIRTAPKVIREL